MGSKRWIRNESGVNLIELMVVVAVAAIVTAIAVPTYVSYLPFLKIRSAARDLMSDLRYTRQQAVSVNKDHRLIFSSATLYIVQKKAGASWTDPACPDPTCIKVVNLADNYSKVTLTSATTCTTTSTTNCVYFKPNGGLDTDVKHPGASDATPLALTLTHSDTGEARTIKINGVGRVWTE